MTQCSILANSYFYSFTFIYQMSSFHFSLKSVILDQKSDCVRMVPNVVFYVFEILPDWLT